MGRGLLNRASNILQAMLFVILNLYDMLWHNTVRCVFFNISDVPNQLYKEIIANARLTCDS